MSGLGWPDAVRAAPRAGRSGLGWPVRAPGREHAYNEPAFDQPAFDESEQNQPEHDQPAHDEEIQQVEAETAGTATGSAGTELPVWAPVAVLHEVPAAEPVPTPDADADADAAPSSGPVAEVSPAADVAPAPLPDLAPMPPAPAPDEAAQRIRSLLEDHPSPVPLVPDGDETPIGAAAAAAVRVRDPRRAPFPKPPRTRTLCISNQKGGVGKTTSTVNLAVALALHGAKVLVVDLDPQGNASTGLAVEHHSGVPDVYDVLINGSGIADVVQPVPDVPGCWCVPATIDLAGAEIELVSVVAREWRLQRALEAYREGPGGDLDYVLVDCPPSLGLLTVNAMVAAQELLIPIQCEYYALEGLGQLLRTVEMVRAHLNPALSLSTILLTMYDARTKLADQVAGEVRGHFGDVVLGATIPRSVRVSEAPGYGKSVVAYDPGSRGALAYVEAAREIAQRSAAGPPAADEPVAGTLEGQQ